MTTQADIKLVIDQLHGMELTPSTDEIVIVNAVEMLETLGNQVAELNRLYQNEADVCECYKSQTVSQAAVIEKLRDALEMSQEQIAGGPDGTVVYNRNKKLLATPTDSTQILQEWLDSVLGEPTAGITHSDHVVDTLHWGTKGDIHLYKKPELKK